MLLYILIIVVVSFMLGHHVGVDNGYDEAIRNIASFGVKCNGECNTCENKCRLSEYFHIM